MYCMHEGYSLHSYVQCTYVTTYHTTQRNWLTVHSIKARRLCSLKGVITAYNSTFLRGAIDSSQVGIGREGMDARRQMQLLHYWSFVG